MDPGPALSEGLARWGRCGQRTARGRSSRTWPQRWRWVVTAWPILRCCGSSPPSRGRWHRIRRCPGWSPRWPGTSRGRCRRSGPRGRRRGSGHGRWPGTPRLAGWPGHGGPGRHDRDRALGEGASLAYLEEDLRLPADDPPGPTSTLIRPWSTHGTGRWCAGSHRCRMRRCLIPGCAASCSG